ncbi:MAG: AAA family ATPase [Candidatus Peribacteria bacterium]|jgi:predicted AAA+ superfamily ATPase|nr:AAA family ATPase [Candidatus Peribacteria bacterium]
MYCSFEIEIKTFFIDEIFRYENWKIELKNIIDTFDINIYFSGSSSMAIYD